MAVSAPTGMKYKLNPATGKYSLVPDPAAHPAAGVMSPVGTAAAPTPASPAVTHPAPIMNPVGVTHPGATIAAPTSAPNVDPFHYVTRNGHRIAVRLSQMTPLEKAGMTPTTAAPAAPTPAGPTTVDPRDATYASTVAQAGYSHDTGVADLNAQLGLLASQYNQGAQGIGTAYTRGTYDSNADLARRGLVQSGEYQNRLAQRDITRSNQTADLERQYGGIAQGEITRHIADLNNQYALAQQSALTAAQDRYRQTYPASSYI